MTQYFYSGGYKMIIMLPRVTLMIEYYLILYTQTISFHFFAQQSQFS